MVGDILQPTHLLFILVVALLVLGPKRLPEVGRQLGSGLRDFRAAINGERSDRNEQPPPPSAYQPVAPVVEAAPPPAFADQSQPPAEAIAPDHATEPDASAPATDAAAPATEPDASAPATDAAAPAVPEAAGSHELPLDPSSPPDTHA